MKKLIPVLLSLSLLAFMGCSGGSGPQPGGKQGPPPGGRPGPPPLMDPAQRLDRMMTELTKRLELTPDQAVKVRAIIKEGEDKKAKMEPTDEDFKSREGMDRFLNRLVSVDKETEKKLAAVLSADQLDEYKDYMAKHRRRSLTGQSGGPGRGGPPGRRGK